MAAVCSMLEARRLILPEVEWWRENFIAELIALLGGAHDDWVDAVAQALNYLRDSSKPGIITYYRWETLCGLVERGLSVEEIAERLHNTPEQVQSWIDEIPAGWSKPASRRVLR